MKEIIAKINNSIDEKRGRIKEKVLKGFPKVPASNTVNMQKNSDSVKTPPISYILYGLSSLSVIGAIVSDSKALCLAIAAASAFGGYVFSRKPQKKVAIRGGININLDKNDLIEKVVDVVKKSVNEWEEFTEQKQREIAQAIDNSSYTESEKSTMRSKIFLYEVIDVKMSEISASMKNVNTLPEISKVLNKDKEKYLYDIDNAVDTQIEKYRALLRI